LLTILSLVSYNCFNILSVVRINKYLGSSLLGSKARRYMCVIKIHINICGNVFKV
jgi:hypothetical protein